MALLLGRWRCQGRSGQGRPGQGRPGHLPLHSDGMAYHVTDAAEGHPGAFSNATTFPPIVIQRAYTGRITILDTNRSHDNKHICKTPEGPTRSPGRALSLQLSIGQEGDSRPCRPEVGGGRRSRHLGWPIFGDQLQVDNEGVGDAGRSGKTPWNYSADGIGPCPRGLHESNS